MKSRCSGGLRVGRDGSYRLGPYAIPDAHNSIGESISEIMASERHLGSFDGRGARCW
jgi:hypothetical protein